MSDESVLRQMIQDAKRAHTEQTDATAKKRADAASDRDARHRAGIKWLEDVAVPILRMAQRVFAEEGVQLILAERFDVRSHMVERSPSISFEISTPGLSAGAYCIASDGKTVSTGELRGSDIMNPRPQISVDSPDVKEHIFGLIRDAVKRSYDTDERLGR